MAEEQKLKQLTPAEKDAINHYLWRLAAAFGIPNVVVLVGAMAYVFFVLPGIATEQARAQIETQSSTLTSQFIEAATNALLVTGKAQQSAESLGKRGSEIEKQVTEIKTMLDEFKDSPPLEYAGLLKKLLESPDLVDNAKLIGTVKAIENRLNVIPTPTAAQGYGNSSWANVRKTASCPDGLIATGIEVTYGGTCRGQCNADGGIVREVKMLCRPL